MRREYPEIIQGGMGAGVSGPTLARAVSVCGELGVVSGTALNVTLVRHLQDGNLDYKRAVENFPDPEIAEEVLSRYFLPNGRAINKRYKPVPMAPAEGYDERGTRLLVVGNFAEVWLAKEGHDGLIGINYLEKLQRPHLASFYGAQLAGVDVVIMGAGIPTQVPGALDALSEQRKAIYRLDVEGATAEDNFFYEFDPQTFSDVCRTRTLSRPDFFAIISSHLLAKVMTSHRVSGKVNGFVVEGHTAGGHNAPPRDKTILDGQAIYNERDLVNFDQIRKIAQENNIPFYLAGGKASPEGISFAHSVGARGIQAGTIFALSEESGLLRSYKNHIRAKAFNKQLVIRTDAYASPSGYPFKVAEIEGSISEASIHEARPELCDLGFLQTLYRMDSGRIGARCPAEEVRFYLKKGGKFEETINRKCICNGLTAAIGMAQIQPGQRNYVEKPIFTLGDDYSFLPHLIDSPTKSYTANQAIAYMRGAN